MKPSVGLVAFLVILSCLATIALRYVPVQHETYANSGTYPMRHTRDEAYAFALETIAALGGLPPDAELRAGSTETMRPASQQGGGVAVLQDFEWGPRDVLASDDRIGVLVSEDSSGELVPQMIIRHWHPAWWRAFEQWQIVAHAVRVEAPARIHGACARGVDAAAVRRVLGARLVYIVFKCRCQPRLASLSESVAVSAVWNHPIMVRIDDRYSIPMRAARIGDVRDPLIRDVRPMLLYVPQGGGLHKGQWHWELYGSDDGEHVCR